RCRKLARHRVMQFLRRQSPRIARGYEFLTRYRELTVHEGALSIAMIARLLLKVRETLADRLLHHTVANITVFLHPLPPGEIGVLGCGHVIIGGQFVAGRILDLGLLAGQNCARASKNGLTFLWQKAGHHGAGLRLPHGTRPLVTTPMCYWATLAFA